MDAFSDYTQADTVVVTNTNATTNDTINTNDISVNDSHKRMESNEIPISNSEIKTLPKKVDIIDIVKDVPKPFVAPVETCDEIDRIEYDNEKLVQVKNEAKAEIDTNIIVLLSSLPYKDDQWSPLNSNGKKVYEKEFLLALRNDPKSWKKPENLLDVIAQEDRARVHDINWYPMGRKPTDFPPNFRGSNYGGRSLLNQQESTLFKRNNQQGKSGGNTKGNSTSNVIASTLVPGDVKLNESENPWKPTRFTSSIDMSDEDKKTQELYKKVRGVLNKLTPQKFETLLVQVRSLAIDTKERLQGVIDLVFEKAVDEPNFSVAYASMCSQLALMQVPSNAKKEGEPTVNFRKLLIGRCQLEFERNSVDETARNGKIKEIEECTDPEKKKELQLMLEEDIRIRRKSVGCIGFIGELYNQGMLTTNIMKKCLDQLLDNKEEESLECLCKLLSTVGKAIEDKDVDLSQTFLIIGEIVDRKHGKISSRVRFMLQDVIDLRNSRWIPKRDKFQPQMDKPIRSTRMFSGRKRDFLLGDSNTVVSQSELTYEQIHIRMLDLLNNDNSLVDVFLWIDANVGERAHEKQFVRTLATAVFENSIVKSKLKSENLRNRYSLLIRVIDGRLEYELECLYALLALINKLEHPQGILLSMCSSLYDDGVISHDGFVKWETSDNVAEQEGKGIALLRLTNFFTQLKEVYEETSSTEDTVVIRSELTYEQIHMNLLDLLKNEKSPDDIFRWIYTNVGKRAHEKQFFRTLATAVFENSIVKSKLKIENLRKYYSLLKRIIDGRLEYELECLYALQALINKLEHPQGILLSMCNSLYSRGVISPVSFVKWETSDDVAEQEGKCIALEQLRIFTQLRCGEVDEETSSTEDTVVIQSELTYEQIHIKLLDLLKNEKSPDDIFRWIYANVGERAHEKRLFRTLATAVFENSIVKSKLKIENLRKYYSLLKRIIDGRLEYELECLYALQALINKLEHPQGILLSMFNSLYTRGVISHDGFVKWKTSDDVAEQIGKGIALEQLRIFTQLRCGEVDKQKSSTEDTAVIRSELTYEQIHIKLLDLLKNEKSPDYIFCWIYANVGERAHEKLFRILATAVFENSIVKSKLKIENLRKYYSLLKRIIDGRLEYELECLYALQALINKLEHPQGILLSMCNSLYSRGVISPVSFVKWETSDDVAEQEGKCAALKQLTNFFTYLRKADPC